MWDSLKSIIGSFAPTIATALGGPLAGGAVSLLTSALGLGDKASPSDITTALSNANPEMIAKIKLADLNYQKRMMELNIDLEKINADDRQSARKRATDMHDWTPSILGVFIIAGFFGMLIMMMFFVIPKETLEAFNIMLGALGGMTVGVVTYFFGSSSGSRLKDKIIGKT